MKRVMIIGQPGAGKSWLARELGAITALRVFHMDQIHWMPGWKERSDGEKWRLVREVHAKEEWIFEGGFSKSWEERIARADTCIWLDFPVGFRYGRVLWRTIRNYGQTRADLPDECPERLNWEFTRWIWDTRHSFRTKAQMLFEENKSYVTYVRLQSKKDVSKYLEQQRGEIGVQ